MVAQIVEVDRNVGEGEQIELDVARGRPASLGDPVESEIAEELVAAFGHQIDVVAAFAPVVVLARATAQDVVAADHIEPGEEVEDVAVVAEDAAVVAVTVVDPVVAGAAEAALAALGSIDDDVVAGPAEVFDAVVTAEEEVIPLAALGEVCAEPRSGAQGIVARSALQVVVTVVAEEDVVALSADQGVVAFGAVQAVAARIALQRAVTDIAAELVDARPAAEDDVLPAVIRIEELLGPIGEQKDLDTGLGIDHADGRRIEDEVGRVEHVRHHSTGRRVAREQLGERVPFQREPHVQTVGTLQVVEAIAVLEILQLVLEDEVE